MKEFIASHPFLVIWAITGLICFWFPTPIYNIKRKDFRNLKEGTVCICTLIYCMIIVSALGFVMILVRLLIQLFSNSEPEEDSEWEEQPK